MELQDDREINITNLPWKFTAYYKATGYLIQVEPKKKEIVVFLPDKEITFIADVSPYIDIKKLVTGRTYEMEFAVYSTKIERRSKELLINIIKSYYLKDTSRYRKMYNLSKLEPLERLFETVSMIYKFELIKIFDHFYSELIKKKYEYSVLNSYKGETKYRWRHLLGF